MNTYREKYGPLALITGASSGIGWGFAEELAARGFDLVLVARRLGRMEQLAAALHENHGTGCMLLPTDLADPDAPDAILAATHGRDIGLVVSNAGFAHKGEHADISGRFLTNMLMVNCHAPMQLARGFAPRLRDRGSGGIILTSSVEAQIGVPFSAAYSASKALVSSFGEALWAELHGSGVDVLTLLPGPTDTEAMERHGIDKSNLEDLKLPRDVARIALDALGDSALAGPSVFGSEVYRAKFAALSGMERRDALLLMAGKAPK